MAGRGHAACQTHRDRARPLQPVVGQGAHRQHRGRGRLCLCLAHRQRQAARGAEPAREEARGHGRCSPRHRHRPHRVEERRHDLLRCHPARKKVGVCGTPRTAQRRGHRYRAACPGGEISAAARRRDQGSAQRRYAADRRLDALRQQGFRNHPASCAMSTSSRCSPISSPPPIPASSAARSTSTCSRRSRTTACARRAASPSSSSSSTAAAAPSWACRARPRSA